MIRIGTKQTEDDPLELLSSCHRRIERFLYVLITIFRQAHGSKLTPEQRNAMETALRYFREAAPKHTRDEEDSLFPRMRAVARIDQLDRLEVQHSVAHASHQVLEKLSSRWLESGELRNEDSASLRQALTNLSAIYHKHIRIEEKEIFPLACRILSNDQLKAVQKEMKFRRMEMISL